MNKDIIWGDLCYEQALDPFSYEQALDPFNLDEECCMKLFSLLVSKNAGPLKLIFHFLSLVI